MSKIEEKLPVLFSGQFQADLKMSLPDGSNVKKYIAGVKNAIIMAATNGNTLLLSSDPNSLANAILSSAALGMPIDANGHGYLVPFRNNKTNKVMAQFVPGYKGYVRKIQEAGIIPSVGLVYEGDHFEVYAGTENRVDHRPDWDGDNYGRPEKIKAAYCIINYPNGMKDVEIMKRSEIDDIKKSAKQKTIWSAHYGEMAKKTVLRRAAKWVQAESMLTLTQYDDMQSSGRLTYIQKGDIIDGGAAEDSSEAVKGEDLKEAYQSIVKHVNGSKNREDEMRRVIDICVSSYGKKLHELNYEQLLTVKKSLGIKNEAKA